MAKTVQEIKFYGFIKRRISLKNIFLVVNQTLIFGIIFSPSDILTKSCLWHHGNLAWTSYLFFYTAKAAHVSDHHLWKKLIYRKLHSEMKSLWTLIFKINRFLSMCMRHSNFLGYKNMSQFHIPERVSFLVLKNVHSRETVILRTVI